MMHGCRVIRAAMAAIVAVYALWSVAPAHAQAVTATLPVTCRADGSMCTQATPVVNPDGTNVGGGGGGGAVTAAANSYALGSIIDLGTGASPGANTVNGRLVTINTTLGSPYQAGGALPLPSGASTSAKQDSLLTALGSPYQAGGALPLPSGASTAANQSTVITNLGSPFQAGGSIGNTTFAVTQATASSLNAQVVGNIAAGGVDSGNGVKVSGVYNSTQPSPTTGQRVDMQTDSKGNLRVNPAMFSSTPVDTSTFVALPLFAANSSTGPSGSLGYVWNGTNVIAQRGDANGSVNQPYAMTGSRWQYAAAAGGISNTTTAVTIAAAAGGTLRNYITGVQIFSDALGAATEIAVRDGAGGTVLWRGKIGTGGITGGESVVFPVPLKGTANTLMEIVTLTASITGAVYFNSQGFTGN